MSINSYLQLIKNADWTVVNSLENLSFTNKRLRKAPKSYLDFISTIIECHNKEDTVWWLTLGDFENTSDSGFKWNEFEIISLESCEDDDVNDVKMFWKDVLPVMYSVKDDYAYIGIVLAGPDKNKIVMGREPMFEDCDIIADNFDNFILMHSESISGNNDLISFQ